MALRFYDEAMARKIGAWIVDSEVKVLKPDETQRLFSMKADEAMDRPLSLPIIALSRSPRIALPSNGKQPRSYDGFKIRAYGADGAEVRLPRDFKLNAIPVEFQYQIDIYCRKLAEADEYMRNFVFNFVNYPNLVVTFKYNGVTLRHASAVHLSGEVVDNSDIPERLFPDQFTRYTLTVDVDDAYLFSIADNVNWTISEVMVDVWDSPDGGGLAAVSHEVPDGGILR